MCSDKNGCNKEEWQNNLTQTATTAKGLLGAIVDIINFKLGVYKLA
jgi:hypothetical protein